jgi:hypothetical protein
LWAAQNSPPILRSNLLGDDDFRSKYTLVKTQHMSLSTAINPKWSIELIQIVKVMDYGEGR